MRHRTLSIAFFSLSFLSTIASADSFTLTITSNHRFARGGDTASICTNNLGNSATSCDFLDRGPNCATDADEQFFDRNPNDPNQQQVNTSFFAHCNVANSQYSGEGIGPQFVFYIESMNGGASGQLNSCILLANQSASQPSRSTITFYEDLNPSASTPKVPGCQANEYALLNLQSSSASPNGTFNAQIECKSLLTGQPTVVRTTLNRSDLHYIPCPSSSIEHKQ